MPSASVSTAASVKPGFVRHCRHANVRSCRSSSIQSRRAHDVVALPAELREHRFDAAVLQPHPRQHARLFGIDAALDQFARPQLDVMRELFMHFLFDRHAPQQRAQTLANGHDYTALMRARFTAAENAAQAAVWLASCCRPARVRR